MQWTTDQYMRMAANVLRRSEYLPTEERIRYLERAMMLVRLALEDKPTRFLDADRTPPLVPADGPSAL
jgi:hypothetical protein